MPVPSRYSWRHVRAICTDIWEPANLGGLFVCLSETGHSVRTESLAPCLRTSVYRGRLGSEACIGEGYLGELETQSHTP